jgi:2'-5' RNA ligase
MSQPVRAFVAVKMPATGPLRRVLSQLKLMGPALKPVPPERLHVTLRFLGDVQPERLPEISAIVQRVAGTRARSEVRLMGLGAFPHVRRPNVVWVGLTEADLLTEMAEELNRELESVGFAGERRPFRPHLTLSRVKRKPPRELGELLEQGREIEYGSVAINAVYLLQSELTSDGPRYTTLAKVELQGD